uniref:Secreted protein n=1 Tax=Strongyloides papillosus TaxID=174720 RepID=A0A0N5BZU2_STREA
MCCGGSRYYDDRLGSTHVVTAAPAVVATPVVAPMPPPIVPVQPIGKSSQGPVKSFECVKKTDTGPPPPGDQGVKSVECTRKADIGPTTPGDQAVKSVECAGKPGTTPGNDVCN